MHKYTHAYTDASTGEADKDETETQKRVKKVEQIEESDFDNLGLTDEDAKVYIHRLFYRL